MRWVAVLLVSLTLAVALAVGAFATLHALTGPAPETVPARPPLELPTSLEIDPAPLDREERRIQFGTPVNASHAKTVELSGALGPGARGLHVLLVAQGDTVGSIFHRTIAEAEGRFLFSGVPVGRYELRVQTADRRPVLSGHPLELKKDHRLELDLDLRTYSFRLLLEGTPEGTPLPKGELLLSRQGGVVASGRSDERGLVSLSLSPGPVQWRVWASGPDWPPGGAEWQGEVELGEPAGTRTLHLVKQ